MRRNSYPYGDMYTVAPILVEIFLVPPFKSRCVCIEKVRFFELDCFGCLLCLSRVTQVAKRRKGNLEKKR